MASNPTTNSIELPVARWVDLRLPDGSHSGIRVDLWRGLLEVQKRSGRHIFDLTALQPIEDTEQLCYTEKQR